MSEYSKYYSTDQIDHIANFIAESEKINKAYPTLAPCINFFRNVANYLFGSHDWINTAFAKKVIQHYVRDIKPTEKLTSLDYRVRNLFSIVQKISKEDLSQDIDFKIFANRFKQQKAPDEAVEDHLPDTEEEEPDSSLAPATENEEWPVLAASRQTAKTPMQPMPTLSSKGEATPLPPEIKHTPDADTQNYQLTRVENLPNVDARMLFHLLADEFGANSSLEGNQREVAVGHFLSYIKGRSEGGKRFASKQESIIKELESAYLLTSKKELPEYTQAMQSLVSENKPFLIPGGWTGPKGGHAIYFEVLPDISSGEFSLRIFNTGEGIQHHAAIHQGTKEKTSWIEWKGISQEQLLDPHFSRIFYELNHCLTIPRDQFSTHYEGKDVYLRLKAFLKIKPENCVHEDLSQINDAVKPQTAGTCSYRSLMAFLKTKMNLNEFRRFKSDICIQSLSDFATRFQQGESCSNMEFRLLVRSVHQLSRKINRLHEKGVVGKPYLDEALKTLRPIEDFVKQRKIEDKRKKMPLDLSSIQQKEDLWGYSFPNEVPENLFGDIEINLEALAKENKQKEFAKSDPCSHLFHQLQDFDFSDPIRLEHDLETVCTLLKAGVESGECEAVYIASLNLFKNVLPGRDSKSRAKLLATIYPDEKMRQKMVVQLCQVARYFIAACTRVYKPHVVLEEAQIFMERIIELQRCLFDLSYSAIGALVNRNLILREKDQIDHGFWQSLETSHWQFIFKDSVECSLKDDSGIDPPEFVTLFLKLIKTKFPEVLAKLPSNKDKPLSDVQLFAILYTSSYLPPVLQALRDVKAYFALLNTGISQLNFSFVNLQLIQGIKWEVATNKNSSEIKGSFFSKDNSTQLSSNDSDEAKYNGRRGVKAAPFHDIVDEALKSNFRPEKSLLTSKTLSIYPLKRDEQIELVHYISFPENLHEFIEYFEKHPDKLKDPDYQLFFKNFFFGRGHVRYLLSKESRAPDFIKSLLKKNLETAKSYGDIPTLVFLLRMGRYFSHFSRFKHLDLNEIETLNQFLARPNLKITDKSYLYEELLAAFSEQKELTGTQMEQLVAGTVFLKEHPVIKEWSDVRSTREALLARVVHSRAIEDYFAPNGKADGNAIQRVLLTLTGKDEGTSFKITSSDGKSLTLSSPSGLLFQPIEAVVLQEEKEVLLPEEISENPNFKVLFSGKNRAVLLSSSNERQIYKFQDMDAHDVLVSLDLRKKLIIQKKIGDQLFEFIPKNNLEYRVTKDRREESIFSLWQTRYLVDHFDCWKTSAGHFFLSDRKTGKFLYEVEDLKKIGGLRFKIKRLSDGLELGFSRKLFSNFESEKYTHLWYSKDGKLQEIEFPRYGLRFGGGSYPGWHLSKNQNLPAIKNIPNALVLENEKGEKKVLIPNLELEKVKEKEVLQPAVEFDQKLKFYEREHFSVFAYEVDKSGDLKATSREAYLYLAKTMAAYQNYGTAAYYLRRYGEKLSRYTAEEKKQLQEIMKISEVTGDASGKQYSIALYAAYLLNLKEEVKIHMLNKKLDFVPVSSFVYISKIYKQYLTKFRHAQPNIFTKQEETRLLKNLLSSSFDRVFFVRLRELDPDYALAHYPNEITEDAAPTSKMNIDFDEFPQFSRYGLNYKMYELDQIQLPVEESIKKVLLTRPDELRLTHLPTYIYKALYGSPEEKKWLETSTIFSFDLFSSREKPPVSALIQILLKRPQAFAPLSNITPGDNQPFKDWIEAVVSKAKELVPEVKKELMPSQGLKNLDLSGQYNFRLEAATKELPNYAFRYLCDPLTPLDEKIAADSWLKQAPSESISKGVQRLSDHLEKGQNAEQKADLEAYQARPIKKQEVLNASLSEVKKNLSTHEEKDERDLKKLEDLMLKIANREPTDKDEKVVYQLKRAGGIQKKIALEDILFSFAKKDPKRLQKIQNHLNQQDLDEIYNLTASYLMLALQVNQRKRSLKLLEQIEPLKEGSLERLELEKMLVDQIRARPEYDVKLNPAYMVFEYFADISMRKDQIEKLELLLTKGHLNPVMEMIMGSGKSKILMPLLALLRTDGQNLSTLIVPQELFESIASDTHASLKTAFAQPLRSLHFDRNSIFTKRSLEEIKEMLEQTIEGKEALIMTGKSVQSLVLKLVDLSRDVLRGKSKQVEELQLLKEIVQIFKTKGTFLIDEADTVLNVLHEVSFSVGERVSPQEYENILVSEIFDLLYNDQEIKSKISLESDPNPEPGSQPFTEKLYRENVQKILAEKLLGRLKTLDFKQTDLNKKIHAYIEGLKEEERTLVIAYLTRNKKQLREAQKFYNAQPEAIKDILALLGEEICHFLPHTLSQVSGVNYGLDAEPYAIPFTAAFTPNKGSVYSTVYITMNYTYAYYFKNGIGKKVLESMIADIQKRVIKEQQFFPNMPVTDMAAWKDFEILRGDLNIPLFDLGEVDIESMLQNINKNAALKKGVITRLIFPQIEFFSQKLACDPQVISTLSPTASGFQGDLWNTGSMHNRLNPIPEPGTSSETLSLLFGMGEAGPQVRILPNGSTKELLDGILDKKLDFDMIADAGGYFKEGGNLELARYLSKKRGMPVVFYSESGAQSITNGEKEFLLSEFPLKPEERLTFLDQSHTVGADVTQREMATSFVTIGRNMLKRDLLQAVWRLRGLRRGQKVEFLVDSDVAAIIREALKLKDDDPIGLKEILEFTDINQRKRQKDDNFKSFKQQIWNIPRMLLLDAILKQDEDFELVVEELEDTWVKDVSVSPREAFGQIAMERPAEEVLQEEALKCKERLDRLVKRCPHYEQQVSSFKTEIDKLAAHYLPLVNQEIISPLSDDSQTVEVDVAADVKADVKSDVNVEVNSENKSDIQLGWIKGDVLIKVGDIHTLSQDGYQKNVPLFPLIRQLEREKIPQEILTSFEGIDVSINVLEWQIDEKEVANAQLFGDHRVPFHHLHVKGDDVALLSADDAAFKRGELVYNYNITNGFINKPAPKLNRVAFEKIVKLKFLGGELLYTPKERTFLMEWVNSIGKEKMKNFFTQIILRDKPGRRVSYETSWLASFLKGD